MSSDFIMVRTPEGRYHSYQFRFLTHFGRVLTSGVAGVHNPCRPVHWIGLSGRGLLKTRCQKSFSAHVLRESRMHFSTLTTPMMLPSGKCCRLSSDGGCFKCSENRLHGFRGRATAASIKSGPVWCVRQTQFSTSFPRWIIA